MRNWGINLLVFITMMSCQERSSDLQLDAVNDIISSTNAAFAPDGRVAIFKIETKVENDQIILTGKSNLMEANKALLEALSETGITAIDSILLLPSDKLKGKTHGIVNNSVSNIRSAPKHSGELATQALLGMPLNILDQEGEWYLVQTPDDYISWIDHGGLVRMNDLEFSAWQALPKVIYGAINGRSYATENETEVVSDMVMGDVLALSNEKELHYEVTYPDGRTAFIRKSESAPLSSWMESNENIAEDLIEHAYGLMGSPYLWGGTSTKGMDCSGFTKTLYHMNGLIIPRDASQQVHAGVLVDDSRDWEALEPGDLLFFGTPKTNEKRERVVHVGMWLGDNSFIHASKQVRISSVNSAAPNYDEFNTNRYLRSKRYIKNIEGNIIDLRDNDIYSRRMED